MSGGKEGTVASAGRAIKGPDYLVAPDGTPLEGCSESFTGTVQYIGKDGKQHATKFREGLPVEGGGGGGGGKACCCWG